MAIERIKVVNAAGGADTGILEQVIPLLVPDYFASYVYNGNPDWDFHFKDADGATVFTMNYNNMGTFTCDFQYPGGTVSVPIGTSGVSDSYVSFVYKCANGLVLVIGTLNPDTPSVSTDKYIIITKDKNGKTAVIAIPGIVTGTIDGNSVTAAMYSFTSTYTDSGSPQKLLTVFDDAKTPKAASNQTQFVPFATFANAEETNYTPKAFITPISQFQQFGWGKFIANGKRYLTNGFFAIEDEEVSA